MESHPNHGPGDTHHPASPWGDGRLLAWILVVAFGLALYTVYEYWRTGTFGNTYFLAAFAVLATLILAAVFMAVRPNGHDLGSPIGAIASTRTTQAPSPMASGPLPAPAADIRFVRRTVAFDGGPVQVIRSDFEVHGMLSRDYELVTDEGSFPLERVEAALDGFRLDHMSEAPGRGRPDWKPAGA